MPYFTKTRKPWHPRKHNTRHYCLDRSPQELFSLLICAVVCLDFLCSYGIVMELILSTHGKEDSEKENDLKIREVL